MSRDTAARRRRDDCEAWHAESFCVASELDELQEQGERLGDENARLRDQLAEVEGWYRLLQVDHAALQRKVAQSGRRVTELQAEANRLGSENRELQVLVLRAGQADPGIDQGEDSSMTRIFDFVRAARRNRWAAAAVVAIVTLLARDAGVQGLMRGAVERTRQAATGDEDSARSGFLRYAAMIHGRDQEERARRDYNEHEAQLKGDALLEAQDRLRAAKRRHREARLAFLPELARQCEQAGVPLPKETAEALAGLKEEAAE